MGPQNIAVCVNSPPSPNPSKQRWNWKRTNFGVNYNWGSIENDTDGAFGVPATGSRAADWGPAGNDVRHRLNAFFGTLIGALAGYFRTLDNGLMRINDVARALYGASALPRA